LPCSSVPRPTGPPAWAHVPDSAENRPERRAREVLDAADVVPLVGAFGGLQLVIEAVVPVRAAAEGLVGRLAAAAEREVLAGRPLAELRALELGAALNRIRAAGQDDDAFDLVPGANGLTVLAPCECAGWALPDGRDDVVSRSAIWIDPGFRLHPPDLRQPIGAVAGMRTDAAVVVDRDLASVVAVELVGHAVVLLFVREADLHVGLVAEGLRSGVTAAAEGHRLAGLVLRAVRRPFQIRAAADEQRAVLADLDSRFRHG